MEDLRNATADTLWNNENLIAAVMKLNEESLANEEKDVAQQKEIEELKRAVSELKKGNKDGKTIKKTK